MNFGRVIRIQIGERTFSNEDFGVTFSVPFSNDALPSEAEITLFNLTDATLAQFKKESLVTIQAGYRTDVGLLFAGKLGSQKTTYEGVTKQTVCKALNGGTSLRQRVQKTYQSGVQISYMIRDLANQLQIPIAQLELVRDKPYMRGMTWNTQGMELIQALAKEGGSMAYIDKEKLYVTAGKAQGETRLISESSGLIGTPTPFEEENKKGWNVSMQLCHSISVGTWMEVKSRVFSGKLKVIKGEHRANESDFITEVEAVF